MSNATVNLNAPQSSHLLFLLTSRLTIGGAVCFSEGISAAILVVAPINYYLFTACILTFFIWLGFWRFRDNKLGADIGDLCFFDFINYGIGLVCYVNGIDAGILWYVSTGIFALKIVRVYIGEATETQQQGWGKFGPMTWFHSKYHSVCKPIAPGSRLEKEIIVALIVAAVASIIISRLPDLWRVAVTWFVPLSFEFLYGPAQLRNLTIFNTQLFASTQRETEQAAKIAELEQKLTALQNDQSDPDGVNAELNAYYYGIHPEQRPHFLGVGKKMRQLYPVEPK